jgi:hypothetical protein
MNNRYVVKRDITPEECYWLIAVVMKGTVVEEYGGYTYGCITDSGLACKVEGIEGFVELPFSSLRRIEEHLFDTLAEYEGKTLDEAAEIYALSFLKTRKGLNQTRRKLAFKSGASWAVKNSPEVLALVEALEFFEKYRDMKDLAKDTLSKWRGEL